MRSSHIKIDTSRSFALIFVFCLILAGCGSGGGADKPAPAKNTLGKINGQAIKGPVSNGTVTAYAVASGAKGSVLGTANTNSSGNYSISIVNYNGPVILEITGGSYTDEATGNILSLPTTVGSGLQAVIDNVSAGSTVQSLITPLTMMAAARAQNMSGGLTPENISAANKEIGIYFGGINIVNTEPVNPMISGSSSGVTQEAINYGLILGGLSQQAQTFGYSDPMPLLIAMANDLSDGIADGLKDGSSILLTDAELLTATASSMDLASAIKEFSNNASRNLSGGEVSLSLVTQLSKNTPDVTMDVTIDLSGTGVGTLTSDPAGIDCGGDCSQDYYLGTSVTLTATSAQGSVFAGWSGACSGTGDCTVIMNADTSVTAKFDLAPPGNVTLNVTIDPAGTGSGTITSIEKGINCGGDCSQDYSLGTSVTLTATSAQGSVFAGWSGACSGTGDCTVTMNSDTSVTAKFDPAPLVLPLAVGRYLEFGSHDSSSPPIEWTMSAESAGEVTIGVNTYSQLVSWGYAPGFFRQGLYRSTENAVYGYDGDNEFLLFQLAPVGTTWSYYSEVNGLPGQTVVELISIGSVNVPYGTFTNAYDYRKYWDPDDPYLPNSPRRHEFVVPGVGIVKIVDYWTDLNAPIVHELTQIGTPGGGDDAFSLSDLAGTWYGMSIGTPQKGSYDPDKFGYDVETLSLKSYGTGTITCVASSDSCGNPEAISGVSISVIFPLGPNEAANTVVGENNDKLVSIWRNNNSGSEEYGFGVAVKKAASYSMSDIAGTWYSMDINTPQRGFSYPDHFGFDFDTMTLQGDGTGTFTCIASSDPCGEPEPISAGMISISPDGIVSTLLGSNEAENWVMGENKDIMIQIHRNNNAGEEHQTFGVLIKKAASYSMSDLAGTWYSMDINTPQRGFSYPDYFGFDFDTMTLQGDGTGTFTCIASNDPCGAPEPISAGMISISPDGIVSTLLGPNEAENWVMGENKDIMIQIHRNNNAGEEHQVFSVMVKKVD